MAVLVAPSLETAIAAAEVARAAQLYVVHTEAGPLAEIFRALTLRDLAGAVTMYRGSVAEFVRDVAITPELLVLEGAAVDELTLVNWLAPGSRVVALAAGLCEAGGALREESPLVYRASAICRGRMAQVSETARAVLQGLQHEALFGAARAAVSGMSECVARSPGQRAA